MMCRTGKIILVCSYFQILHLQCLTLSYSSTTGGSVIFTHAGDDCTDIFAAFHPIGAMKELKKYEIGILDDTVKSTVIPTKTDKQIAFEQAYRELRLKLINDGLFDASLPYYAFKVASNLSILALSIYCATQFESFAMNMIGAVLLGLFWQQCGWLAHDFLHHQVFKKRVYGDMMGIVIGDLFQGFSVQWWKSKHNAHHACPNLHASVQGACDGDPDIDTMPLLAWSLKMAENAKSDAMGRFMISFQALFYFPLLLFARFAWAYQSWVFVWGGWGQHSVAAAKIDQKHMKYPLAEKICLALHYTFIGAIMANMPSVFSALMYFVVGQTSCGLMLALVFGLGHNGMAVYPANERPDFWKLQVTTTRNVTSNWFSDWFCGGLQYQVEHHLFPSCPRHNLGKVHKYVEAFCEKHDVTYHEADMVNGNIEVLQHLSKIAKEFLTEFPAM
jgi:acyl-lipid Delta6-acetylenase / acyl-lipid (9-3)-desaturase